jgi:hypothetical protein
MLELLHSAFCLDEDHGQACAQLREFKSQVRYARDWHLEDLGSLARPSP